MVSWDTNFLYDGRPKNTIKIEIRVMKKIALKPCNNAMIGGCGETE